MRAPLTHDQILAGAVERSTLGWSDLRVICWLAWQTFRREIIYDAGAWVAIDVLVVTWCVMRVQAALR